MRYCLVSNGVITNIIVCDAAFAESIGAVPCYDGAEIGGEYTPYQSKAQDTRITALEAENKALTSKLEAAIQANANLEDCLVEMAEIVYA